MSHEKTAPSISAYYHRIARTYNLLRSFCKHVEGPYNRYDYLTRSSMMLTFSCEHITSAYEKEVAAFSYILAYAKEKHHKNILSQIRKNFGINVQAAVEDLYNMIQEYNDDEIADINGHPYPVKEVFLLRSYVDAVSVICADVPESIYGNNRVVFDHVKNEVVLYLNGEQHLMPFQEFVAYVIEDLKFKVDMVHYVGSNYKQAICEIVKRFKDQKGFEFIAFREDESGNHSDPRSVNCSLI